MLDKAYYVCKGEHLRTGNNNEYGPFGELQIGDLLNSRDMYNIIKSWHADGVVLEGMKERVLDRFSITEDGLFEVYFNFGEAKQSCLRSTDYTIYEVACDRSGYRFKTEEAGNIVFKSHFYKEIAILKVAYRICPESCYEHFPIPKEEKP